jgi:tetratricopeptide (TPR) repeat protein
MTDQVPGIGAAGSPDTGAASGPCDAAARSAQPEAAAGSGQVDAGAGSGQPQSEATGGQPAAPPQVPEPFWLRAGWVALGLALLCFIVYNLNLREVSAHDTIPARFLPLSILAETDLDLDEFEFLHLHRTDPKELPYYLQYRNGHYYSSYPVLPGIMAVPVYVIPTLLGLFDASEPDFSTDVGITSKVAAALFAALSVAFVYLACRRLFAPRWALGAALLYAFATGTLSTSSQGLWQHGPAQLWLAAALWCLLPAVAGGETATSRLGALAALAGGLSLGLAVAARGVMAVPAAVLFLYALRRNWRTLPFLLVGPALAGALVGWYNFHHFGTLLGGEAFLSRLHLAMHGERGSWKADFLPGLYGLFFSANRGLVVFTPLVLLAAAGAEWAWRKKNLAVLRWLAGATALTLLVYGFYSVWWGGWSYGPRYACDVLPLVAVLMAAGLERAWPVPRARIAVLAATAYCVAIQVAGFLCYAPATWNLFDSTGAVVSVDLYHYRLWDWSDWEVLRCLRAGLAPTVFQEKARDHAQYADTLLAQGDTEGAGGHYREALYWDRNNVRANTGLGVLLLGRGDLADARSHLLRAVEVKPTDAASQHNLGCYYLEAGDPQQAAQHLAQALKREPTREASWRYFAAALYRLGRYDDAARAANAALAVDPNDAEMQQLRDELDKRRQSPPAEGEPATHP